MSSVDTLCTIKVKPRGPFEGILWSYKFLSAEIALCVSLVLSKARALGITRAIARAIVGLLCLFKAWC